MAKNKFLFGNIGEDDFFSLMTRVKPLRIFVNIENCENVSRLARKVNVTYSHTVKLINFLEELGFVKIEKEGRSNSLSYTGRGKKVQQWLLQGQRILTNGMGD
jgi:predicted transcriptional regulator